MGYQTWSRSISPDVPTWRSNERPTPNTYLGGWTTQSQTTTSFRSGSSSTAAEDDILLASSTDLSVFKKLKKIEGGDGLRKSADSGHTFKTERTAQETDLAVYHLTGNQSGTARDRAYWYEGPLAWNSSFGPSGYAKTYPDHVGPSYNGLNVDGPAAIRATIPTAPAAQLAVGTGELLRDGLPKLWFVQNLKDHARDVRKVGDEYLNHEFGWAPLIKDLHAYANAVIKHEKLMRQFQRDSGRVVRRRFAFPDEVSSSTGGAGSLVQFQVSETPWGGCFISGNDPTPLCRLTTTRKKWFSGAYQYFMHPSTNESMERVSVAAQKARLLLGLKLDPETVWNLSPWSWMADWVGNVGDNLANNSRLSSDSLVIRYGYMMVETSTVMERTGTVQTRNHGDATISMVSSRVTKERFRATPYGFGLNPAGFSAQRWAILGALGLTRGPQSLDLD